MMILVIRGFSNEAPFPRNLIYLSTQTPIHYAIRMLRHLAQLGKHNEVMVQGLGIGFI